jgi:hypothetical protein
MWIYLKVNQRILGKIIAIISIISQKEALRRSYKMTSYSDRYHVTAFHFSELSNAVRVFHYVYKRDENVRSCGSSSQIYWSLGKASMDVVCGSTRIFRRFAAYCCITRLNLQRIQQAPSSRSWPTFTWAGCPEEAEYTLQDKRNFFPFIWS